MGTDVSGIKVEDTRYRMSDFTAFSFKEDYKTYLPVEFGMRFWDGGGHSLVTIPYKDRVTFTRGLVGYLYLAEVPTYRLDTVIIKGFFWNKDKVNKVYLGTENLYLYVTTEGACFASKVLLEDISL